jgi:Cu+-exporting ATPase
MGLMYVPLYIDTMDWLMPAIFVVATFVQFWAGRSIYASAWQAAKHHTTNMTTLVALGTGVAWTYSTFVTLWPAQAEQAGLPLHVYYETSLIIVALVLAGKWMEARAKKATAAAVTALVGLAPRTAGSSATASRSTSRSSRSRSGDRPHPPRREDPRRRRRHRRQDDGRREHADRGEPAGRQGRGDQLIGATINTTGSILMRATAVGDDTALAQIVRLVEDAQGSKVPMQRLADRVSSVFVPAVIVTALVTALTWALFGPAGESMTMAVTTSIAVLIIACPCALGLATPTAVMVGTGRAAELGILISNGEALEQARRVTAVVLDKTGTITRGKPALTGVTVVGGWTEDDLLRLAAAAETGSEHPVAQAVVTAARDRGLRLPDVRGVRRRPGHGLVATVAGYRLGSATPRSWSAAASTSEPLSDCGAGAGRAGRHADVRRRRRARRRPRHRRRHHQAESPEAIAQLEGPRPAGVDDHRRQRRHRARRRPVRSASSTSWPTSCRLTRPRRSRAAGTGSRRRDVR